MPEDRAERRLAAILAADMVGYSRPGPPEYLERSVDLLAKAGLPE